MKRPACLKIDMLAFVLLGWLLVSKATPGLVMAQTSNSRTVILATTTSIQDSGLLDVLIPAFEKKTGYIMKSIAVGTGEALAMGRRGEADALLVHSPQAEERFMADGYGFYRKGVMHNDFIIVGPPEDPARIKGSPSPLEAMRRIASSYAPFISRGDNSGTHQVEKGLWKKAGINPHQFKGYIEAGQGMGETLIIAAQRRGYVLTDRGTYLALKGRMDLTVLFEGDNNLRNPYSVILVNPLMYPKVNQEGARAFADFLVSEEAQRVIKVFGVEKYGRPLFYPDAIK